MTDTLLLILACLYALSSAIYIMREIHFIKTSQHLTLISIARLMYTFVYGLLPFLIYARMAFGVSEISLDRKNWASLFLWFLFSVIGYLCICAGYQLGQTHTGRFLKSRTKEKPVHTENTVFLCAVIVLVVGWISLFLWTRAYGSIWTFIENANAIRAGYGDRYNPLAFFTHFAKTIQYALYAFWALFLHTRSGRKLLYLPFLLIAFVGTVTYTLASDSRASIGFTLIACAFIYISKKVREDRRAIGKNILKIALIGLAAYLCIVWSDPIMRYIRFGTEIDLKDFDLLTSIIGEFGFIPRTQQKALQVWYSGEMHYMIINDIINALTAWLPSRFIPFALPTGLWAYNTSLFPSTFSGTVPTDILSAGIYHVGILGICLLPFLYGRVLSFVEKKCRQRADEWYSDIVYYGIATIIINSISHFRIESLVLGAFPLFVFLIIWQTCSAYGKRRNNQPVKSAKG